MDQDERLLHSSSFGAAAVAYAEHRPDYARAAVRWALAPAAGPRVLDLGAGTGKLTATLLALGADTVAVEPDPAMLSELRRSLPEVRALPGSAEAIPLPDGSVDAVLAGNALHWFDMAVAGPEIARVLVPGGILAGLWNVMNDEVDGPGGAGGIDGLDGADGAGEANGAGGSRGPDGAGGAEWAGGAGGPGRAGGAEWVSGLARVGGSAVVGPRDTPAGWRAETATRTFRRRARPPVSARLSGPSSRTGSAVPPTPSSRPSRRAPACWSCRNRSAGPRWTGSAAISRADRRPPAASSRSPC
ncbi:hypothetical protein GCM10010372_01970 [Streptomyces tauricus]|uniref:class I SAM-dependent methyltransferase n=1 Tax=Streptomyces tauricus TaxID=68274 RepID=UPI00199627D2|nr:class I SAM-dependent methyltransferase [Streptomyces tauricus]GHA06455.1 hypothetical protein GCM10010372_01970 [Streptomyces tauricus]